MQDFQEPLRLDTGKLNAAFGTFVAYKPDICVYHGNCLDGFTAAWAVWKKWPDIQFYGATHGKPIDIDVKGKHVLMVDFAPKARDLLRWETEPKSLIILDHHVTAESDLKRFHQMSSADRYFAPDHLSAAAEKGSKVAVHFDMQKSGARLAWEFVNRWDEESQTTGDTDVPNIVKYVEDRDLWRFQYADSKPFTAYLGTVEQEFGVWDYLARPEQEDSIVSRGHTILHTEQMIRTGLKKEVYRFEFHLPSQDSTYVDRVYVVPVVNAPYHFASELANEILLENPDAPFAACWFHRADGKIQWSLRSLDERADVSKIARAMGGGGHRNAAGFECHPDVMQGNNIVVTV